MTIIKKANAFVSSYDENTIEYVEQHNMQMTKKLAETNYFSSHFISAMKYGSSFLKNGFVFYPYEIIKEHMAAFTYAAIMSRSENYALEFYRDLETDYNTNLPLSVQSKYNFLIKKQMSLLIGDINEFIDKEAYEEPKIYLDAKDFFNKININSQSPDPLLNQFLFIYKHGCAEDYIRYYTYYSTMTLNPIIHIKAAKVFDYFNQSLEAYKALNNYIELIKKERFAPMPLFLYYSLYHLYTIDFLSNIIEKVN